MILEEKLRDCGLAEAQNVLVLLSGEGRLEQETQTVATAAALLESYQTRCAHLEQFTSHHAGRLLRATQEFCSHLAKLDESCGVAYARVDDNLIGSYIVWFTAETFDPVGCLYVIGKSEVPEDAWHGLWFDD